MRDQPSTTTLLELTRAAEELVKDLRSGTVPRSTISARARVIRNAIVDFSMLVEPFVGGTGLTTRHGDGLRLVLTNGTRANLLHAWGYANFILYQINTGRANRQRLAEYADGLRDELVHLHTQVMSTERS